MKKNPRATKEQVAERENAVLEMLELETLSAQDIAIELNLSYPQTLLIIGNLLDKKKIERIPGREQRKILYTLCDGCDQTVAHIMTPVMDSNNLQIRLLRHDGGIFVSMEDMDAFAESTPPEIVYGELRSLVADNYPEHF